MTEFRTRAFQHPATRTVRGRRRLRAIMAVAPVIALLTACAGQMRPPSPITTQQRAELDKLAASKDAPQGLKEALAGVDAYEKRRDCRDRTAAVAQQMKTLGVINAATLTAGKMGGNASTRAAKMVAVMNARTIKAQVAALPNCSKPTP